MGANYDFFTNNTGDSAVSPNKPFFTTKGESKEDLLIWLKNEVAFRESINSEFFSECRKNLQAYRGSYFKKSSARQSDANEIAPLNKFTSKYFVNHLYEMTENMVSRMTRVKPSVEVLPSNDEYADKISAKAVDLLLRHLYYINDIDLLMQKMHRQRLIFGESFTLIDWDDNAGDLHPEYVQLRDSGKLNKLGEVLGSNTPIKVGDVSLRVELPWNILLENKMDYSDVKSIIIKKLVHIEELKLKYPKLKSQLSLDSKSTNFNLDSLRVESCGDNLYEYTLYHKSDKEFPNGKKICFLHNLILSNEDLGFSHGDFPVVRLTDLEIPGRLHGMSRYSQVLILQNAHNNLSQSIIKNEFLLAAPKWMMPKGACKVEQLNNGRTVVQYQGPIAPQLVQMNPTSPATLTLRDQIMNEIGTIFGVHQVSRGEPPKGITAAVALQFLNDQETERAISDIAKHNIALVEISKKMISTAGDNYEADDGRILRVFGKNNKHMIAAFDEANLHKDYDIRIQNSSAVPQSKAARMERIIQTMQYAPDLFTPDRWAELLEFGATDKMHSLITEAINAAESEEEDILDGIDVDEPKEWEDHICHLRSHYKRMQGRAFKEDLHPQVRSIFIEHVLVTEMLASEKAAVNPLFASKLAQIEQYPMFWKMGAPPMSAEHQAAVVQGETNQGLPVTGAIPASEPETMPGQATRSIRGSTP